MAHHQPLFETLHVSLHAPGARRAGTRGHLDGAHQPEIADIDHVRGIPQGMDRIFKQGLQFSDP